MIRLGYGGLGALNCNNHCIHVSGDHQENNILLEPLEPVSPGVSSHSSVPAHQLDLRKHAGIQRIYWRRKMLAPAP